MTSVNIRGIPVNFPFEPYEIQKVYMDKVIECLQNEENGVLESPTGTGKTLSLLCSSLAWLTMKKAQIQAQRIATIATLPNELMNNENSTTEQTINVYRGTPTIIYASRTHSQLTQVMQELKRSSYSYMRSTVIGSRDQMCLHPDVSTEQNAGVKIHLCRTKVKDRTCKFYNCVELKKKHPTILETPVFDIEDLVNAGTKLGFCPYYMAKELKQQSDIVFMPYNYILDPRARKALGIELSNNIIILDEGHNIEKMCEDSASIQIKSTDIALCIDEVTDVMKCLSDETLSFMDDTPKDFSAEELCILKEMLLKFEMAIDEIEIKKSSELTCFPGNYIFEILRKADITDENAIQVNNLVEKVITFLLTRKTNGPYQRKGNGLQILEDLFRIVFAATDPAFKEKLNKCYKVNISMEEVKKKTGTWISKSATTLTKVLSFWCFSPGFGMYALKRQGIRCIILTSGTLAPLAPLISELEIDFKVHLENPHIIKESQICVKILCKGPDEQLLSSAYSNRDNSNYMRSLGNTILNVCRFIPNGVLVFFPSYFTLQKCQDHWQQTGIWTNISKLKPIFVEPKQKDAFQTAMTDYYAKVRDPAYKGAIFIGVCRGKISEGLDFADHNGRAVIITGLPYPPLKDPKVILKREYLNACNKQDRKYLTGEAWYSLEAARAINQAIGRVIRHRNDYGAILLLDSRFNNPKMRSQLSLWLREHIKVIGHFGEIITDLIAFYRLAEKNFSGLAIEKKAIKEIKLETETKNDIVKRRLVDNSYSEDSSFSANESNQLQNQGKKKRFKYTVQERPSTSTSQSNSNKEIVVMMQKVLNVDEYKIFLNAFQSYRDTSDFNTLINGLDKVFINKPSQRYLIQLLAPYVRNVHQKEFESYWEKMK